MTPLQARIMEIVDANPELAPESRALLLAAIDVDGGAPIPSIEEIQEATRDLAREPLDGSRSFGKGDR